MKFETYSKILTYHGTNPSQIRKSLSDEIMDLTWNEDLQSKTCYIYDFNHEDESEISKNKNIQYNNTNKFKIDAKFIITQYGTLVKDQPEYHIQFKSSQLQPDWFNDIEKRYKNEFPIGLYIDIPDDKNVYRRWLICSYEYGNQFIKYSVLPCNYRFAWIYAGKPYLMWGVARLRNSYNSGIWSEYITTTVENQDQMWLPMNDISKNLFYDQRIIVSSNIPEPITWKITKVESIHPFGINKLTLGQTEFNYSTDFYSEEDDAWFADWIEVMDDNINGQNKNYKCELIYNYSSAVLKVGGSNRVIKSKFYNDDVEYIPNNIEWKLMCNDEDVSDKLTFNYNENNTEIQINIKQNNGYMLIGKCLEITVSDIDNNCFSNINLSVVGL